MKSSMNRRDFLKMAGMLPLSVGLSPFLGPYRPVHQTADAQTNVMVIVFDAFSAYHLRFHGYPRKTTPMLNRLAKRAIVYHNHHAGGNFTTPGTASLLTGTLPWTHRALQLNGRVKADYVHKTLFNAFAGYHRIAYSHNPLVNTLLKQFAADLDEYVPQTRLFLTSDSLVHNWFGNDEDIADVGWTRSIKKREEGYSYSLFLADLYRLYIQNRVASLTSQFPRGIPSVRGDNHFLLEDAIDWVQTQVGRLPQPYFAYLHFMPPHAPTSTSIEFFGKFTRDKYSPPWKPDDVLSSHISRPELLRQRAAYDEYLLYVDREFGRLFDYLDQSGVLENTWLVLTSDHGELFERGVRGHISPLLYQPVVRVPLLIFEPGRTSGMRIDVPTSAIDLLPTLLHVTGRSPASWAEGSVLPPFASGETDPRRAVYAVHAKENDPDKALTRGTAMVVQGNYKVMVCSGYEELEGKNRLELYDLQSDPEEMHELGAEAPEIAAALGAMLQQKLDEVNKPYP